METFDQWQNLHVHRGGQERQWHHLGHLERIHLDFVLAGAELQGEAKQRFQRLQELQAELAQKFSEHVLDATDGFAAYVSDERGEPGVVMPSSDGLWVGTGDGSVLITDLQLEGKKRMEAREFLRGHPIAAGTKLG